MLRSDAQGVSKIVAKKQRNNILNIDVDAIAEIESELRFQDLVSLVFLLYDVPDTALQRLVVYERVAKDMNGNTLNLLYDWALYAKSRPTWRSEFLEALSICQLHRVIKKLGFEVEYVQIQFSPDDINSICYINPIKKCLYILCENTTSINLSRLKNMLKVNGIDTSEYTSLELVLLDLMCKKFITVDNHNVSQLSHSKVQLEKLYEIVEMLPGLEKFAVHLKQLQMKNDEGKSKRSLENNGKPPKEKTDSFYDDDEYLAEDDDDESIAKAFENVHKCLSEMTFQESAAKNLKADTKLDMDTPREAPNDIYPIKDPKRVGVCYIINQEEFQPNINNIGNIIPNTPLETRYGSTKDKIKLEKTMAALNFEVISHRNLGHIKVMEYIKHIIQYRVHPNDSMFMLCILSHGVSGHVYAADSVKIKIDNIQNLLDETLKERELDIPKIMILQACQVNAHEELRFQLAADNPYRKSTYHLKKLNFLIYWATAPELEAYRDMKKGSLFIQGLCYMIKEFAKREHLYDIFTKVNNSVTKICKEIERDQVPIFLSTLTKKLYLQIPE